VKGTELNFHSLLCNFKIDIQGEMLPMSLIWNQIRYMLGGERDKITLGKIKYKFGTSRNKNSALCTTYLYTGKVQTPRLLVLSLWHCLSCGGIWLTLSYGLCLHRRSDQGKQKHPLKLSAYIHRTAVLWLDCSGMWPCS